MLICVATGFASGLPLYLLTQLVPVWLRLDGVSLTTIGVLNAIQYLYVLKFMWAPALERYSLTALGRRRSWMLATQIPLIILIASLGYWQVSSQLTVIAVLSIGIVFFSATQDVVLDAYRREILETEGELALGNSIHVQAIALRGWCRVTWAWC